MKATSAFVIPIDNELRNGADEYLVVFTTGREQAIRPSLNPNKNPLIATMQYGGRFPLESYAAAFAQLLLDGAA